MIFLVFSTPSFGLAKDLGSGQHSEEPTQRFRTAIVSFGVVAGGESPHSRRHGAGKSSSRDYGKADGWIIAPRPHIFVRYKMSVSIPSGDRQNLAAPARLNVSVCLIHHRTTELAVLGQRAPGAAPSSQSKNSSAAGSPSIGAHSANSLSSCGS